MGEKEEGPCVNVSFVLKTSRHVVTTIADCGVLASAVSFAPRNSRAATSHESGSDERHGASVTRV